MSATRSAANGVIGRLALACTASSMFTGRLPAAIRRCVADHPHVEFTLHEMASLDQLDALHERTRDVGIRIKDLQDQPLITCPRDAGIGIAIVPSDTQCIRLEGEAYQRIIGKDAVSTLYLAHRPGEGSEHVKPLLLALRSGAAGAR